MARDEALVAEEAIMNAVCDLCHWPYIYRDEEIMIAEKCENCPAAAAVSAVLEKIGETDCHTVVRDGSQ